MNTIKEYISGATLLFLIGVFVQQVRWQERTDTRIEKLENHATDQILHMPFEKRIVVFVPRVELEGRLNDIQKSLDRINNKLDNKK